MFVIKQMSEAKGKSLYVAYMDLEKAYDRSDRIAESVEHVWSEWHAGECD